MLSKLQSSPQPVLTAWLGSLRVKMRSVFSHDCFGAISELQGSWSGVEYPPPSTHRPDEELLMSEGTRDEVRKEKSAVSGERKSRKIGMFP